MAKYRTPEEKRELRLKGNRNRLRAVGGRILDAIKYGMPECAVTMGYTTSDQPLIRIETPDGIAFHCTVAKARK
jgi:hypothetical protein